ncbi:MAG: DUF177 domain-containing protein [Candidatus Omnitrophica bacterium]|nr:DUF177 domain-containing protein [Candidatus Omnitrophota bacterium]
MRVALEQINDRELEIHESLPASSWDMDSDDIKFVDDITLHCKFFRIAKEIMVEATVGTRMAALCSRCLAPVSKDMQQRFQFNYDSTQLGEYLEMDSAIREEILLNFPLKVLCKKECRGLCPGCGINLNSGECTCKGKTKRSLTTEHRIDI